MSTDTEHTRKAVEAMSAARKGRPHTDPTLKPMWNERRLLALGVILGCMIGLILLVGSWTAIGALSNCHRIQRLDQQIVTIETRALHILGTRRSPGFAYYRAHPNELVFARQQAAAAIRKFDPPSCSLPF